MNVTLGAVCLLGIGLSMDAFAVSICKGLALRRITWKDMALAGIWFGGFQGLMPLIGYLFGRLFAGWIETFSAWAGFLLLSLIGGNMIREALKGEDEDISSSMAPVQMLLLAIATSIDALAVGLTFAAVPVRISASLNPMANTLAACLIIAGTTFGFSAVGIRIGETVGARFRDRAQVAGGIILILIGLRILLAQSGTV